ncbi:hypothetical protein NIB75_17460 [Bacteroides uniformis]|nr:hypothetical protein [Bacteroides uniformis]
MRVYSIDPENPEETIKLLPRVPMGQVKNVYKALYPSNRWRDFHDFNAVSVYVPRNVLPGTGWKNHHSSLFRLVT